MYEPRWKGKREDLVSVDGEKTQLSKAWSDTKREVPKQLRWKIISHVLEIAVLVAMNTHLYEFDGKIYRQRVGGPIGMRFTACLAPVIMMLLDLAWLKSMKMEGITIDLYVQYVDDSWNMLRPLNPGWRW